jgi:hypothetical protein
MRLKTIVTNGLSARYEAYYFIYLINLPSSTPCKWPMRRKKIKGKGKKIFKTGHSVIFLGNSQANRDKTTNQAAGSSYFVPLAKIGRCSEVPILCRHPIKMPARLPAGQFAMENKGWRMFLFCAFLVLMGYMPGTWFTFRGNGGKANAPNLCPHVQPGP